jgi:hypothetical protein
MTEYRHIAIPGMTDPIGIADQPSPMLQWVEIAAMVIDDQYQRPINVNGMRTVKSIAANFRWSCFTPVLLAPIEGGMFAVIDGQHRVHAALLCGIKAVPAMVVPIAATEQALAFVQVNTARTAMSAFNLFKAGLAAGEEWAIRADKAVADAGCKLMRFHPSSKSKKSGEVYCVGLIRDLVTRGHDRAVTVTLDAVKAIDAGGPSAVALYSEYLLKPLMTAVTAFPDIDVDQLIAVLRRHRPFNVVETAQRLAKSENRPGTSAARDAFRTLIGSHLRAVAA